MSQTLPYDFDLHFDIKTMDEVEQIARGESHRGDATPGELVEMFHAHNMPIPHCLKHFKPKKAVWLHRNGTWSESEPLEHEKSDYRKAIIDVF